MPGVCVGARCGRFREFAVALIAPRLPLMLQVEAARVGERC